MKKRFLLAGLVLAAGVLWFVQQIKEETEDFVMVDNTPMTRAEVLARADQLAASYDYDNAIALLQGMPGYQQDAQLNQLVQEYETVQASCVEISPDEVTHIFYHSLVVDPELGFSGTDGAGFSQWMTTVEEFNRITQQMYDNGYVLVRMRDLVEETIDADGTVHFTEKTISLPPGKKPFVLSLDDLCYYHSYEGHGMASKMVLDENGKPKCEYVQADGTVVVGNYDCVPLLDAFIEEHPDASYRGAKGMIALTGYNGILGYRTDSSYRDQPEDLYEDKKAWLAANPDYDWEKECAQAKEVAEAMIADGWEFASHTWGHRRIAQISLEELKEDTEKWMENVAPLIGGSDTIIFAHGEDLGDWHDYAEDNEKYQYLKSMGFHFFCNVDSSQYFLQIRDGYVRQGRRNLDGYRLFQDKYGDQNRTADLFDVNTVYDVRRPAVPELS